LWRTLPFDAAFTRLSSMKLDLLHLTSVGDQKQIFGGIGQDHVQKTAANQ
jgi:hypothetical protein